MPSVQRRPTINTDTPAVARYAAAKSPDIDIYNGSTSRDFCNCFWGVGDAGVNVLFARVRGGMQSMRELQDFWNERAIIEEQYAGRLLSLAKTLLGKEETGEVRAALEALVYETETQGTSHQRLAAQLRSELEEPTTSFVERLTAEEAQYQAPLEARWKSKHTAETAINKAREKYESNCLRLASYTQQMSVNPGKDPERLKTKIAKARETVSANERELSGATNSIRDATVRWQKDWKEFCDYAQDGEEERVEFLKDMVWGYANAVSTICVEDDQSCERVRVALDNLDPLDALEAFVEEYGTGSSIPEPISWVPFTNGSPQIGQRATRPAQFTRVSTRPPPETPSADAILKGTTTTNSRNSGTRDIPRSRKASVTTNGTGAGAGIKQKPPPLQTGNSYPNSNTSAPPSAMPPNARRGSMGGKSLRRDSAPLPRAPTPSPVPPPLPPMEGPSDGRRILFIGTPSLPGPAFPCPHFRSLQALYDYTATIDEEFDFQAGDIIGVTATPDDGWWSGELLDDDRRKDGKYIFPSNFVTLF
ncbi:SH3-domain-containing protein [Mycena kentingensis (nom. inval.)]|nr:SH3-domain-containing protein [Mycena kentingensis (nom. inval.)]